MSLFLDSFWRAVLYCVRPRVIALSFLPLILIIVLAIGLGYFFWDMALDQVRSWMDSFAYMGMVWQWLDSVGAGSVKTVLAPLLVVFGVTPLIVVGSMLAVAFLMTPALVHLVVDSRFPALESRHGAGIASSVLWALGSTVLAALALVVSVPLWLIPPLVLLLPPLVWGWLTYRIMAFDALAEHASQEERRALFKRHAGWLLLIGVISGYLGAMPSVLWAFGASFAPAFIILVPAAIWIYTLVFAFASLWFIHYCLAALQTLRAQAAATPGPVWDPAHSTQAPGTASAPALELPAATLSWKDEK